MTKLRDYIADQLESIHRQDKIDWYKEADLMIEKMLDPNYTPRKHEAPKRLFTKVTSYKMFLEEYQGDTYNAIYNTIYHSERHLSRAEIAEYTGIRLSTVCGRVSELMDAGAISVTGKKLDKETNRLVEVLTHNLGNT